MKTIIENESIHRAMDFPLQNIISRYARDYDLSYEDAERHVFELRRFLAKFSNIGLAGFRFQQRMINQTGPIACRRRVAFRPVYGRGTGARVARFVQGSERASSKAGV